MRIVRFSRCRMISAFHISFIQQQQKLALESWPTPLALLLFENNFTFILVSTCLASSEQWRNIALPWILTLPVSPVFPNAKAIHVCDLATRTCPFSPVGILYLSIYFFMSVIWWREKTPRQQLQTCKNFVLSKQVIHLLYLIFCFAKCVCF